MTNIKKPAVRAVAGTQQTREERLQEALEMIAEQCEDHPAYIPDATDEDMHREGGDAASITYWAQIARKALEYLP